MSLAAGAALRHTSNDMRTIESPGLLLPTLVLASAASAQVGWVQLDPAQRPSPRANSAMAYDSDRARLVLFGGWGLSEGPMQDTWEFDGSTWQQRTPATNPPARSEHTLAYDSARSEVLLFGGRGRAGSLSDTWSWDGNAWTRRPAVGPFARQFAAMGYDQDRSQTLLFGGDGPVVGALSDTWAWDGSDWAMLAPTRTPSARSRHSLTYDSRAQRSVLFGGRALGAGPTGVAADTWEWDWSNWVRRFPATIPPARCEHAAVYSAVSGTIVMFGGLTVTPGGDGFLSDTWVWDGANWQQHVALGPSARTGHTMAYDAARGVVMLFGGSDSTSTLLADTWQYFAGSPSSSTGFGTACPGTSGTPALAATAGSLPWIGETFSVRLSSLPPSILNTPFGLVGVSRTQWLGLSLPVSLGAIGAPGCNIHLSIDTVFQLLNTGGTAMWNIPIPHVLALTGGTFYLQGLVLDRMANPLGLISTNAAEARIGIR